MDADCDQSDAAGHWRAIPLTTASTASKVAAATSTGNDVTAGLLFGLRPALTQAPGNYVAPITFEVVAPNA